MQTVKPTPRPPGIRPRRWEARSSRSSLTREAAGCRSSHCGGRASSKAEAGRPLRSAANELAPGWGESAFQVDFDKAISGGGHSQRLCELELELLDGEAAELVRAARHFADRVPMRVGVLSKAERGFALAEGTLDRVNKAGPVAVNGDMTIGEAFTVVAHACIRHYRLNEPLVIATQQPAVLHRRRCDAPPALRLHLCSAGDPRHATWPPARELRWFTSQLATPAISTSTSSGTFRGERRALTDRREQAYRQVIEAMGRNG